MRSRPNHSKSDQKKKFLATCKIDLDVDANTRTRSITNTKLEPGHLSIKVHTHDDDEDSEFDHGDECDENLGDWTERNDRRSITELISLHKLYTSKPQTQKLISQVNQQQDDDSSSSSSFEDLEQNDDTERRVEKRETINDWDMFYW